MTLWSIVWNTPTRKRLAQGQILILRRKPLCPFVPRHEPSLHLRLGSFNLGIVCFGSRADRIKKPLRIDLVGFFCSPRAERSVLENCPAAEIHRALQDLRSRPMPSPLHLDSQVENLGQHPLVFELREHAPNLAVEIFGFVQREAFDIDIGKRVRGDAELGPAQLAPSPPVTGTALSLL